MYCLHLDADPGLLYAAGAFCRAGDDTVNSIVVRDLGVQEWLPLISKSATLGLNANNSTEFVRTLALDNSVVYAGGIFTTACGVGDPNNLARWVWGARTGVNAVVASPGQSVLLSGRQFIGVPSSGAVFFGGVQ